MLMERASLNTPTTTLNNLENVLEVDDIYKTLGILEICMLFLPDFQPDAPGKCPPTQSSILVSRNGAWACWRPRLHTTPLSDLFTPPSAASSGQLHSYQHLGTNCVPPGCVDHAIDHTVTVRLGGHTLESAHLAVSQHLPMAAVSDSSPRPLSPSQFPLL